MHERHKRALNAVRKRFRAARNDLNLRINAYEVARENYINSIGHWHGLAIAKMRTNELLAAIERYQEAGDILVTVERLLEKA